MNENFRRVKSVIIIGVLLTSLFFVFAPTASAGILRAPPLIIVQYPPQEENIIPNSGVLDIVLETTIALTGPWRSFVERSPLLYGSTLQIRLNVESSPDWCDASIANPTLSIPLDSTQPFQSRLTLTVTEKAPAFQQGTVKISAKSVALPGLLFTITEERYDYDISFEIGYWPVISYSPEKGNYMKIGPMDTADFPIKLENLGNGVTYVQIEPIGLPGEDWSVSSPSSVTLSSSVGEGAGSESTIHLVVKPPYGFGFHRERQDFQLRLTPYYLGNPELRGITETMTFTVENVGISPGYGFEIPLIIFIIVIIAFIIYFFRYKWKWKK
jgi:hypothetical protein